MAGGMGGLVPIDHTVFAPHTAHGTGRSPDPVSDMIEVLHHTIARE